MLAQLAGLTHRRPGRVLVAALLFGAAAAVFGGPVPGLLHSGGNDVPSAESSHANQRLLSASGIDPNSGFVLVVRAGTTSPAVLGSPVVTGHRRDYCREAREPATSVADSGYG